MNERGLIIMLCRNGLELSQRCLCTLLAQSVPVEILVVDNASSDGTAAYMRAQHARCDTMYRMSFSSVTSVARCWNEALWWGWDRGHEEALAVNNDTELLPKTYEYLRDYMREHEAGVVTGISVEANPGYPEGEIQASPHPDYSCFMIDRKAHRYVPFDQQFKGAYFEDCDHHLRMFRARIPALSINLEFTHHRSSTLKHATPKEKERIERAFEANRVRFQAKHGVLPGTPKYEQLFQQVEGVEIGPVNL